LLIAYVTPVEGSILMPSGVLGCGDTLDEPAARRLAMDEADDEEPDDGNPRDTIGLGGGNMVERSVL